MTMPGGPTRAPRKPRATEMASRAMRGTGEHRVTEWILAILGVALAAAGVRILLVQGKDAPTTICAGMILAGIGLIPGAAVKLKDLITNVAGPAAAAWKSKNGGAS